MHLKPGDPAPDFEGVITNGNTVRLADYRGKKLVLYFYPMDDTPGCTRQACSLRDGYANIADKGATVLGVSSQDEASHRRFTQKFKLNFPLLADTDQRVARAYGTVGGMFGPLQHLLGMSRRITFIIDEQGNIAHIITAPDVGAHATEVLRYL
ncbi:MAG: peroxiredoxin [Rhodocyclaceae bacterium]|nr:peroxiredoxin [Rhodocyclaceae bacterium]MBX3670000.1 peroxiredoxin [Rhodocyclaceae bacterium]